MNTNQHKPKPHREAAPQYARAAAACQRFGISRSTLWQWAQRPDFPKPLRVGPRTVLYDVAAVDAFVRAIGGVA